MNELRRHTPEAEAVARARGIVARHARPDFIVDFDVRLGLSDGRPAIFILYKTAGDEDQMPSQEWKRRAVEYRKLDDAVLPELVDALGDCFPFSFLVPEAHWDTFPD
ncbi:MAG: hypothetical protein NVSMB18_24490 [Acetobacteraceae bacterium]